MKIIEEDKLNLAEQIKKTQLEISHITVFIQ